MLLYIDENFQIYSESTDIGKLQFLKSNTSFLNIDEYILKVLKLEKVFFEATSDLPLLCCMPTHTGISFLNRSSI